MLRSWLADRFTFHPDPIDVEWVDDPVDQLGDLLAEGRIRGDCDDAATLGATLARAMGLRARFVVAGFGPPPAPFAHVWAEVSDGGRWFDLDVTREPGTLSPSRRSVYTLEQGTLMMQSYPRQLRGSYDPYRFGMSQTPALGILPAVPIVVTTTLPKIAEWIGVAKRVSSLFGGGKEEDRLRMTDAMYAEAIRGNQIALLFLKQRTGNYGIVEVPGMGQVGGWGSPSAKAYAARKYEAALSILGQTGPNLVDVPGVGPVGIPQGVKEAGVPIALAAGIALLLLTSRRRSA